MVFCFAVGPATWVAKKLINHWMEKMSKKGGSPDSPLPCPVCGTSLHPPQRVPGESETKFQTKKKIWGYRVNVYNRLEGLLRQILRERFGGKKKKEVAVELNEVVTHAVPGHAVPGRADRGIIVGTDGRGKTG
jgi:hypothetical protein